MKHVHACTDPQHHVDDAAAFVRAVERACSERGLRLTPIRAHVLGLIADAGRPLKAYDLLDQVREGGGPGAAAPPTVYRALDFLLANGFIHKLQSVNAFVACHHPSTAQHSVPFLICDRCHSAVELETRRWLQPSTAAPARWASCRRRRRWKCTGCARPAWSRPATERRPRGARPGQKNMRMPPAIERPGSGAMSRNSEVCGRASRSVRLRPSRNSSHWVPSGSPTRHAMPALTRV